jgi:hypothetical protein
MAAIKKLAQGWWLLTLAQATADGFPRWQQCCAVQHDGLFTVRRGDVLVTRQCCCFIDGMVGSIRLECIISTTFQPYVLQQGTSWMC